MRIALLTDIHSNREALEACLEHAAANGAERYVFLGDYVGYGADPTRFPAS
jgi:predicted phosphodiesterase